jgi:hypothetical protein
MGMCGLAVCLKILQATFHLNKFWRVRKLFLKKVIQIIKRCVILPEYKKQEEKGEFKK